VADRSNVGQAQSHKSNPLRAVLRFAVMSVFAVLNRVVDALGMGDSLVVELRRCGP
jgi:hypothetical protein